MTRAATQDLDHLRLELMNAGRALVIAYEAGADVATKRADLARFCTASLLPRLEEDDLFLRQVAASGEIGLLAEAMRAEIMAMKALTEEIAAGIDAATVTWEALAATRALHTMLAAYTQHHYLLSS
jgi:hypothetical protein